MDSLFSQDLFCDRTGVLATMHRKEQAIAPILEQQLGVQVIVPQEFNTDEFGTFTRDIKRAGDQCHAARLKTARAMDLTGLTLAFASEGSFGPHPAIPFVACDQEIVLLSDRTHDLEIVGQAISTETNYSHKSIQSLEAALTFAQQIGFPTHGLVVMSEAQPRRSSQIVKGITDETHLIETVTEFLKKFGQAHLETDMRAMHNPTRMKVIAQATEDLVQRINQRCPQCGCPGFAPAERKAGLPCGLCGSPTNSTLAVVHRCIKCEFNHVAYFPDGQEFADPTYCLRCNP
jgi:ribosomal protein S27AE